MSVSKVVTNPEWVVYQRTNATRRCLHFSPLNGGIGSSAMEEREVGNFDGIEGGKGSAYWTLLEIMKPRGYLAVGACHWRSCKLVTY